MNQELYRRLLECCQQRCKGRISMPNKPSK